MKDKKLKEIKEFIGHMGKMDNHVFDGHIPAVDVYLVYGGRSLKLSHWPEVVELLRAAVKAEKEYWEEF